MVTLKGLGSALLRCFSVAVLVMSFVGCVQVSMESVAWAYVDPGAGALLWQVAVGAFISAAYYLRRIVKRFRRRAQESSGPKSQERPKE
jgi:hypothetical protein